MKMRENIQNNKEQLKIYDEIYQKVIKTKDPNHISLGSCFYIDGPAGSGKSYLLNGIIKNLKIEGYKVLSHATTGIAADLLKDGRTAHSRFKIPLFVDK
jgi:ABC-type lipoprotein export system ATPase subunit